MRVPTQRQPVDARICSVKIVSAAALGSNTLHVHSVHKNKSKAYGFGFQITDISFDGHLLQLQKNMWIVPLIESKESKLTLKKKKCVIVVFDKGEADIYRSCETYKTFSVFQGKS